ncbi:hypothetical protein LOZ53_004887 [Ophidiomyces ophidiicola]|nr:hypothetical protein LOZ55_002972 [Ophidiomyces ophidiicola]KAI1985922.1 hypothetical protein LOZ53_004887 [Ophidiomyces ophidiicola]KAI1987002.1 hypothetical protein LOZ54_003680 [Ophidiomyces ophidiicola]KAI1992838.1 hypothetical protein LOZ51_004151 [Ophidiomyces ophidiicola]
MAMSSPATSARKAVHKLDVEKVSLNLQDRLGLAKVKYERMHGLHTDPMDGSEDNSSVGRKPSSTFSNGHPGFDTPTASTPLTSPILTKDLPRSARSKHAAMFDLRSMEAMTGGSRKRRRCDSTTEKSAKANRIASDFIDAVLPSSPTTGRQRASVSGHSASYVSQSDTIPDDSILSPEKFSDQNIDPELPTSNTMLSSSPPRTPSPRRKRLSFTSRNHQDGADLLMYLANSPTPITLGDRTRIPDFFPSTPPAQHAYLPSLLSTPGGGFGMNFNTPGQPFNFADFVNVTPSPAQRPWGNNRTPRVGPKTPIVTKEVRKRLNFDALVPPSGSPNTKTSERKVGLALQLGEEFHF